VSFGAHANLSGAIFRGETDLRATPIDKWREQIKPWVPVFLESHAHKQKLEILSQAKPDAFNAISFASAHFGGIANFSGRNFLGRCDLTGARFGQPPKFDECKGTSNIDLYGAAIRFSGRRRIPGWTTDSDVAVRLRALRKLADETKNHDLERDLYIEERKAERGIVLARYWSKKGNASPEEPKDRTDWRRVPTVLIKLRFLAHCLWVAVMCGYWLLSDYGRSFVRPLLALGLSVLLFKWAYVMAVGTPSAMAAKDFEGAAKAYAIANSLPFVGALTLEKDVKMILLCAGRQTQYTTVYGPPICSPLPSPRFQLVTVFQSIFSAICIFFAGLALRNYFKLR
jgi:hypothetical protein